VDDRWRVSTSAKAGHCPSSWYRFGESGLPMHHFEVWRRDQRDPVFVYGRCRRDRRSKRPERRKTSSLDTKSYQLMFTMRRWHRRWTESNFFQSACVRVHVWMSDFSHTVDISMDIMLSHLLLKLNIYMLCLFIIFFCSSFLLLFCLLFMLLCQINNHLHQHVII